MIHTTFAYRVLVAHVSRCGAKKRILDNREICMQYYFEIHGLIGLAYCVPIVIG